MALTQDGSFLGEAHHRKKEGGKMARDEVEAEILCLSAEMLLGKATKNDVARVIKLAMDNNCCDILTRELADVGTKLNTI